MTVKQQQLLLEYLGYSPGLLDGIMGSKTKAAITEFQKDNGLVADGICGQQTEKMLKNNVSVGTLRKTNTPTVTPTADKTEAVGFWVEIKHFKREEFRCPCGKCGGFPVEPNEKLVRFLDRARDTVWKDRSVTIIPLTGNPHNGGSGIRCRTYNATLSGSVADSRHCDGKAADIIVSGLSSGAVKSYLDQYVRSGELRYVYSITNTSTHLDVL